MVTTYKAIDLHKIYDDLPRQDIILLVAVCNVEEKRLPRKIKVTNKRYLDIEIGDDDKVKVLIENAEEQKYSVVDVPCKNREFRLDFLVEELFSEAQPVDIYEWTDTRKELLVRADDAVLSECAVVFGGNSSCSKKLIMLQETNLGDKDIFIQRVWFLGQNSSSADALFQKCLNGERIDVEDFFDLVDFEERYAEVEIEFNSILFRLSSKELVIEKPIGSIYDVNEKLSCTLSRQGLGITSLFFSRTIMEEDKNNTFQYLSNYYFA